MGACFLSCRIEPNLDLVEMSLNASDTLLVPGQDVTLVDFQASGLRVDSFEVARATDFHVGLLESHLLTIARLKQKPAVTKFTIYHSKGKTVKYLKAVNSLKTHRYYDEIKKIAQKK
jgi:hypothetical protein